ncbi:hypothetical protein PVL29_002340 [Vitis rotundifolia]|uniref:ADP-ribosyl cyclase/cyclic ADP-ribose hydrolase n=1 Tax=Vitis rotundifolia TaxID=103349 RepID=A0AA39AJD1_VITRO|nr:hypothetical protein PVL29_002340 [Vitis rotundifolia]
MQKGFWKYDVFLSFRGEDSRYTFTDHLYKALRAKGIETFMDYQLRRGELITPAHVTAIEGSRHSIIVLSENYASSKWCLDELVKMLTVPKYQRTEGYVGNQRGSFGKALADHEEKLKADHEKKLKYDMERVQEWRKALTQVGKISGFTSSRDKPETQFIEEIVTDISKDLNCVSSSDAKNLVGMTCCIRELESLLCLESTKVLMVGIWGMGGIGKTTLTKVIYERLFYQFEARTSFKGIRDKNINMGLTSIKARLHSKKVLVVIDDVNHRSMLETLVGGHDWFGPQSQIIITTRDKHLLTIQGVDAVYEVQKLEDDNAIQLFSHYAFKNKPPTRDIMKLLDQITSYAQGLPLALKVLGCSLCDRNADSWTDKLNQLKKIPNGEIQEVLQISFDGLEDNEKEIFLDIACFFRGRGKTFVRKILESCGFSMVSGIENLIDKSLITITWDDRLEMHDLLQEVGWQIIRKTSPKEPGKRRRLWEQKDISHILKWETMTNLRLLEIYRSNLQDTGGKMQCKLHISDDFKFHYDGLRYLHWDEYPCESLPFDFESENLVHFYMPRLWKPRICGCQLLPIPKETPDFSRATNLEVLVLKGCTNCKVHPSLGYFSKLILLNLENCTNLEHLPSIRWLVSLETLILSDCSKLEKLPEVPQLMPYLSKLCLDGTAITDFSGWSELGNFQENSGNLDCLNELNSDDSTIRQLPSSSVVLRNHNASPSSAPRRSHFIRPHCTLTSLTHLNLSGTPIIHLPWNLERLFMLQRLELTNCRRLQALPVLPSSIERMNASNCTSLELISPQSVFKRFGGFLFGNCFKLRNCHSKMEHDGHPNVGIPFSTIFPGSEIPDWFRHHSQGHEINIEVPPDWYINSNFLGFALSAVMAPQQDSRAWYMYCDLDTHDLNSNSHRINSFFGSWTYQLQHTPIESDHVWLAYVPSFFSFSCEKWSHIKFSFSSSGGCVVKSCGFCPVYIKGTSDEGDYSSGSALDEPRRHAAKPSRISYQ